MNKKKLIIIGIILAILILLVPIPMRLKDGGSVEYKALLYSITKVHRLNHESVTGYEEGIKIEILGMEIYDSTSYTEIEEKVTNKNEENSTSAYVPDGMEIASKDDVGTKVEEIIFNRDESKVTIEVLEDTVTSKGVTIIITDKNEDPYGWGKSYKIQKKGNNDWVDLKPINEMTFEKIAYVLDKNGQFKENLNFTKYYNELESGIYRIVKDTYNKGYVYFYSNEFMIK